MLGIALLWHKKNISPWEAPSLLGAKRGWAVSMLDVQSLISILTWISVQHPSKPLSSSWHILLLNTLITGWVQFWVFKKSAIFLHWSTLFILPFKLRQCCLISASRFSKGPPHSSFTLGTMLDPRQNNKNSIRWHLFCSFYASSPLAMTDIDSF